MINNGIIIIFPEGTRFDKPKLIAAQKFSLDSNIPIYNNLLVPKVKGLWVIYDYLKINNKFGTMYDITIISQKYLGKKAYFKKILKKPIDNVFIINRKLTINENNYDKFKLWLFNEWKNKDDLIKKYKNINFQKMDFNKYKNSNILKIFFIILFIYLLTFKYVRYYLLIILIISYIILLLF